MIEHILIKNFALIEDLTINFSGNFNVLTGETGAGKSIVIDALSILLGGRAQSEFIRSGTEKAILEGVFFLPIDHAVWGVLREMGYADDDSTLILSREISLNGRNICRVNGRSITLGQYRQIGLTIVDIHGQHDHQSLLQADKHLSFLDQLGGSEHLQLRNEVKERYDRYLMLKRELEELKSSEKERLQRMDFLNYQLAEIKEAKPKPGELEELTQEVNILAHVGKINESLNIAYQQVFGGERGISAYDLLSKALGNFHDIKELDHSLAELANQLESALYVLEESASQIRKYLEEIEYSPEKLEESEKRLQLLKDICKKYGPTIEEVLVYAQKAAEEVEKWTTSSARLEELADSVTKQLEEYTAKAQILSRKRKELAKTLESKVIDELMELAMPHVHFSVNFLPCEPTAQGVEQVEFLISPNPGEPLLPVVKIASGGELSRIMLALKTILADMDGIGTLIFDEIDSGIGGKAAQKVADKLARISRSQQVVCVTHSPFIAALGDHHFVLEKVVEKGRTRTTVYELGLEERVEELARMLGGENPSHDLKKHALKILKRK